MSDNQKSKETSDNDIVEKWNKRHFDGAQGYKSKATEGQEQLSKAYNQQLSADKDGRIVAQEGPGPGLFNPYSVSVFAQSLAEKLKKKKFLFAFNTDSNILVLSGIYSAGEVGKESRVIKEPVPLPYVSYIVSSQGYDCGVYLKALKKDQFEIICLGTYGCKLGAPVIKDLKYLDKETGVKSEHNDPKLIVGTDKMGDFDKAYCEAVSQSIYPTGAEIIENTTVRFVHTALNGSTNRVFQTILAANKFNSFVFVGEDSDPNEKSFDIFDKNFNFPSIPDDYKINAEVIIGHNSDGSQLAVAEKDNQDTFVPFSASELGQLLSWWLVTFYRFQTQYRSKVAQELILETKPFVFDIGSTFLERIARIENLDLIRFQSDSQLFERLLKETKKRNESPEEMVKVGEMSNDDETGGETGGASGGASTSAGTKPTSMKDVMAKKVKKSIMFANCDNKYMCDPEFITVWDGLGSAIHLAQLAIYLRSVNRVTLRQHLTAIQKKYKIN